MWIETNDIRFYIEFENHDFETQGERDKEKSKVDDDVEKRARVNEKMFIPRSCNIGFLCWNMRIEANNASYNMELKN